jgi:hypothetical protein
MGNMNGVFCHLNNSLFQQISEMTLDVGAILYVASHTSASLLGHKISLSFSSSPLWAHTLASTYHDSKMDY